MYIEVAWKFSGTNDKLRKDLCCCISIACQQVKTNRLSDKQLNHVCYRWLCEFGVNYPKFELE